MTGHDVVVIPIIPYVIVFLVSVAAREMVARITSLEHSVVRHSAEYEFGRGHISPVIGDDLIGIEACESAGHIFLHNEVDDIGRTPEPGIV